MIWIWLGIHGYESGYGNDLDMDIVWIMDMD